MRAEEVMTILEENKITNVQSKHKCKGHLCDKDATIEDPQGYYYCDECYSLFSYTRKEYWSNPNAKGYTDRY